MVQGDGGHQRRTLDYDGTGYFRVTNVNSGKLLDVPPASTADGAALVQFTSNGANNQKWRVVDLDGGAVRLVNKNSGKVAEVFQSSSADAAAIDPWTVNGGTNQIWRMTTP
ncbi:MAG TPA: RICIN domain-containing protein [Kofleriaceae bacterium]|nr:RICIN domain-containing protein [Kofleriaceae bacterium]